MSVKVCAMPASTPTLRERRDELDLTNDDLARALHISYGYLCNILGGTDAPSNRIVIQLAKQLRLPVPAVRAQVKTVARAGKQGGTQGDPSTPPGQPKNPPRPKPPTRPTGPRRATASSAATS